MKKRILSLILVLALLAPCLPVAVGAEETISSATEGEIQYAGSTSFGTMLADALEENQAESEENSNCNITNITVLGNTATVELESDKNCTLVVALYSDEGTDMLTSNSTEIVAGTTEAVVKLSSVPTHFLAKAFLLDTDTMYPLCEAYATTLYTEEIQTLLTMSASDFEEDRVLNLDEDPDNNFAVYSEDTIILKAEKSEENVITYTDSNSGIYVIENATAQFMDLQPGDTFAYSYGNENVLIVKVKNISISGTTVTITEDNTDMDTVFDFVKIDTSDYTANAEVDNSNLEEGIEYEGLIEDVDTPQAYSADLVEMEESKSVSYKLAGKKWGNEDNFIEINGKVSLNLKVKLQCYMAWEKSYLRTEFTYSSMLQGKIGGQISSKIRLGDFGFSPVPGLYVGVTPTVVLQASAKLEASVKISGKIGFQADLQNGVQNLSKSPNVLSEWKLEGKCFFGLSMEPNVKIIDDHVAKASAEALAGAEIKGTIKQPSGHSCKWCLDGEVNGKVELSAGVTFISMLEIKAKKEFTRHLFDFYYSFDHSEWGEGDCPYTSGESGGAGGEVGEGIANGTCGENAFWVLDENGTLTIYGTGEINDYTYSTYDKNLQPPWVKYKDTIVKAIVQEGITSLGNSTFESCKNLSDVSLPNSLYRIGNYAFYWCEKMTKMIIPKNVKVIDSYAFYWCDQLAEIAMPEKADCIGEGAFTACESLQSIELPEGITTIERETFYSCKNLQRVYIPASVSNVGFMAFNTNDLKDIYFGGSAEQWEKIKWSAGNLLDGANIHLYASRNSVKSYGSKMPNSLMMLSEKPSIQQSIGIGNLYYNEEYALIISKSNSISNMIFSANLLYIDQKTAEENGTISFSHPDFEDVGRYYIGIYGPGSRYRVSKGMTAVPSDPEMPDVEPIPLPDEIDSCPKDSTCPVSKFLDTDPAAWYHNGIHYCIKSGFMQGKGNGRFGPSDHLTRAELTQVLWNKDGNPSTAAGNEFSDVKKGNWYYSAVTWAAGANIVSGYGNGKFGPDTSITRQQLVAILYRYAKQSGTAEPAGDLSQFNDADKISNYAKNALSWAVGRGIISGKGNGRLDPGGFATRAEVASILQRFAD